MSKIIWDKMGERFYETGVDHGVLYPIVASAYPKGVAWNGLTSVTESPSGAEPSPFYADNIKYANLMSAEEYGATIEAYTYPDEFEACDGSKELTPGVTIGQQERQKFGLCYRTLLGNDTDGTSHGYKLHIIWNAMASPSERQHQTVNDSPELDTLSWEITTDPVEVANAKPTSSMVLDSTKLSKAALAAIEEVLYGKDATDDSDAVEPRLPMPDEIVSIITTADGIGG